MGEHRSARITPDNHHVQHQKAMASRKPVWEVYHPNNAGTWSARMMLTHPHPVPTDCLIHGESRSEVRLQLPPGVRLLANSQRLPPDVEEIWVSE